MRAGFECAPPTYFATWAIESPRSRRPRHCGGSTTLHYTTAKDFTRKLHTRSTSVHSSSTQRRMCLRLWSLSGASAAPSSRGSYRQLYTILCVVGFHFEGNRTSHCSPAASSNSGSASHAHSTAPPGRIFCARLLRLSVRPSATRFTVPVLQM